MGSKLKRLRRAASKDRAWCPFKVARVSAPHDEDPKQHKGDDTTNEREELMQLSPFYLEGVFNTRKTMNLSYLIEPCNRWRNMTRYKSFVLNGVKYYLGDFVYITNEVALKRKKAATDDLGRLEYHWVAKILEIRASDHNHVYARIYWMYSGDDLRKAFHVNEAATGRQGLQIPNELIASNHMDVINVISVVGRANVQRWGEPADDNSQHPLYWRRALDYLTKELSKA